MIFRLRPKKQDYSANFNTLKNLTKTNMKSIPINAISILSVLAILFTSCSGGGQKQETAAGTEGDEFDEAKSQVISNINQVIKELPPPSEVPYLLMATGTDFDASLVNSLENLACRF